MVVANETALIKHACLEQGVLKVDRRHAQSVLELLKTPFFLVQGNQIRQQGYFGLGLKLKLFALRVNVVQTLCKEIFEATLDSMSFVRLIEN